MDRRAFGDIACAIGGEDREMIVLDHHCIGKRVAMIVAPATADRIAFDQAQARRGLACVHNPCSSSCNG